MERFFAKSGHLAQPLVLQWLMREVVQNGFRMQYRRVANKPWLHFKQVLFALQASLACDAECVCFERKTAEKRWKSMPFIYNKVLKRHEKAVAPSGGNSVTGMLGVKYFYRAAAWLVVYSPLSGLNAECEKALPIGKNRRVVFVSLAVLGESLLCGDGEKKGVHPVSPCVEALNAHPLAMPSAGIVACYGFPRGRHPSVM